MVIEGLPLLLRGTGGHVVVGGSEREKCGIKFGKKWQPAECVGESRAASRVERPMPQSELEAASKDTQAHEATT